MSVRPLRPGGKSVLLVVTGLLLVGVCGCGWVEAEQARRDAMRAEQEARRAEMEARERAEAAAAEARVARDRLEKEAAEFARAGGQLPVLPPRAPDDKPKDPPRDPNASESLITTFEGHEGAVLCVAFSPDNRRL